MIKDMEWNPLTQRYEEKEEPLFPITRSVSVVRPVVPITPITTPPFEFDENALRALRINKGTILKKTAIKGIAQASNTKAQGCSDALVKAVSQGAKEAEFGYETTYSHSSGGCCGEGSSMKITGRIWGKVKY
ncbi:MAG: hypothetical protein GF365_03995 [Candidatus Buchananbacteria bacterium]|nr:hypothetical protein [Candidatus Buchananbacteria bacterium]